MCKPYAADPSRARGRQYRETESDYRSCFQRDRDRIIHSSAFRRMKHKTQVFVEHEGDYYRTRLTHSLEVAQVARTISGALGLNVELTEAVALAHDLGHTPFGHTGEEVLDELMKLHGGFDHNSQALRIVTSLERHYAEFNGLNLTWETLEGIAKHNGPIAGELPWALSICNAKNNLELHTFASAEAQSAALADDIAYCNHDLHDGLRARLFNEDELMEMPIIGPCYAEVDTRYPGLSGYRRRHEALRRVFGIMVGDIIERSRKILEHESPKNVSDVRNMGCAAVQFSDGMRKDLDAIRNFLFKRMYRAPIVLEVREQATQIIKDLFPIYMNDPRLLPEKWQTEVDCICNETELARLVSDYISGMTDRFALQSHRKLAGGSDAMLGRIGI